MSAVELKVGDIARFTLDVTGKVTFIHAASAGAPAVNIEVDGETFYIPGSRILPLEVALVDGA